MTAYAATALYGLLLNIVYTPCIRLFRMFMSTVHCTCAVGVDRKSGPVRSEIRLILIWSGPVMKRYFTGSRINSIIPVIDRDPGTGPRPIPGLAF